MMEWFRQWFGAIGASGPKHAAAQVYVTLVGQARDPLFYAELGVSDSMDGRFDMIALHAFLVMQRLKGEGEAADKFSQHLFDAMFDDMDRALRELGVGDMGVGKRVRAMGKAFMGRAEAYELAADNESDMKQALARNLFRGEEVNDDVLNTMVSYMSAQRACLASQATEVILDGDISFDPATAILNREAS